MESSLYTAGILDETSSASDQASEARDGVRRALNILVSTIGIVVTLPLMLLIAVCVWASSPGPVLFIQSRVGLDRRRKRNHRPSETERRLHNAGGRPFLIYKFRTMTVQPRSAEQVWATRDDPRVTSVGRILRKYRLDELPQLFNVLKGDMNLVGPRPEQPAIFCELRVKLEDYPIRQRVLPGITGLAQVSQEPDQCLEDASRKLEYDLEYVRMRSPLLDLEIMAKTVPVMLALNVSPSRNGKRMPQRQPSARSISLPSKGRVETHTS